MTRYFNHTSLRIADPNRSLNFYKQHFGLSLLKQTDYADKKYTQYLIGLTGPNSSAKDAPYFKRSGLLQLVHDHNATPSNFSANSGNQDPGRGYGHICFTVADLAGTCEKLEKAGVTFKKRLTDGSMKFIAFALDPDGYWIELVSNEKKEPDVSLAESTTIFNHTMIRVKNKHASLDFYTKKLGFSHVHTMDMPEGKFTLFFLSYNPEFVEKNGVWKTEGLLELTYNYGGENDDSVSYHSGNSEPYGFRHIAVAVEQPEALAKQLAAEGVTVVEAHGKPESSNSVTIADPDGYHIQIVPQSDFLQ